MRVIGTSYAKYINSPEWRKKRQERLIHDDFQCSRCETKEMLEVHHLSYERLGNEPLTDLVTLCHQCHRKEHGYDPDLPACLSKADYAKRERLETDREMWQEVIADALQLNELMEGLFILTLGERRVSDPRVREIRRHLNAILDDYACVRGENQEEEAA